MEASELLEIISRGEDSRHQFKTNIKNAESLAGELVAFSNSGGGRIFIGVNDDGEPEGLRQEDIRRVNQLISNTSSQNARPEIRPKSENIKIGDKLVIVLSIQDGVNKPYSDHKGVYWVKVGSDKTRASREELQRLFQASALAYAEGNPVHGLSATELDLEFFKEFYEKKYNEKIEDAEGGLSKVLTNLKLNSGQSLTIAGGLLFGKAPQLRLPAFIVKGLCFPGEDIEVSQYLDSEDMEGKISDMYQKSLGFILRNLRKVQGNKSINSTGDLEIPKEVFEELLVNALVHRDYFTQAPVKIFIFSDRVELTSPGSLPNNLSVESIKKGISNIRNPVIASFAAKLLPYRGIGTGIIRSLKLYPNIEFINDSDGNIFKVLIHRPKANLQGARYDARTRFPEGFDPEKAGMERV